VSASGPRPGLRRLRRGELVVLLGSVLVLVSLFIPGYDSPAGHLDAWDTFGAAVALLLVAACAGLAMVISALSERSTALPVSTAVWCIPLGLAGVISAIVRLLERPDGATGLAAGSWLALVGAIAILGGAWETLRDEHTTLYEPFDPQESRRPPPQ
jgi:hypothetical protein